MKLEYEATLDDISEVQVRCYLRSKSFARQRYREPVIGFVTGLIGLYVISLLRDHPVPWWLYPLAAGAAYLAVSITIKDTVTKRLREYVKRELGGKVPFTITYDISDSQLSCSSNSGVSLVFDLGCLTEVTEEAERLELVFGDLGLCLIPLRVFRSAGHKEDFIRAVRRT